MPLYVRARFGGFLKLLLRRPGGPVFLICKRCCSLPQHSDEDCIPCICQRRQARSDEFRVGSEEQDCVHPAQSNLNLLLLLQLQVLWE